MTLRSSTLAALLTITSAAGFLGGPVSSRLGDLAYAQPKDEEERIAALVTHMRPDRPHRIMVDLKAGRELRGYGDRVVDYILREHMMEAADWNTRINAVTALGFVRTSRSGQLLVGSYDNETDIRVLHAFAESLAKVNSPETRGLLTRILDGTGASKEMRGYASVVLTFYHVVELTPLYIKLTGDRDLWVRRNAYVTLLALGRLVLGSLHTALTEAPSRDQRRVIAEIIGERGTRHSIECLESARRTEQDEFVLQAIDKAVTALSEKFANDFDGPKLKHHQRKRQKK